MITQRPGAKGQWNDKLRKLEEIGTILLNIVTQRERVDTLYLCQQILKGYVSQ